MNEIFSDLEKDKITTFLADETLREAVRKALLFGIYHNGVLKPGQKAEPLQNFALSLAFQVGVSNEQLGQDVRASAEGIRIVQSAFTEMEKMKLKPKEDKVERHNPAE